MCDVLVLRAGGGWATDQTGSLSYCRTRIRDLAMSNRGRRQITRLVDRRTGREVR
jgi:hypothetical protein